MKANTLPSPPPPSFIRRKEQILAQLAVPDAEYSDLSPKGSVDAGIRALIGEINALEGFVTTSSCAGRVSVFVEGRKTEDENEEGERATRAAVGGKGGGGTWLYVSHDPVTGVEGDVRSLFGLEGEEGVMEADGRLIHFKFEPMILHVLTASLEHAQFLLRCGLQAGFRESGSINVAPGASGEPITPIVAIRSMGLSLESLIGVQTDGVARCTVSETYLRSLVRITNDRFEENTKRIERFRNAVMEANGGPRKKKDGTEWEDAAARRERKRAEGLRRKAELQGASREGEGKGDVELGFADMKTEIASS